MSSEFFRSFSSLIQSKLYIRAFRRYDIKLGRNVSGLKLCYQRLCKHVA